MVCRRGAVGKEVIANACKEDMNVLFNLSNTIYEDAEMCRKEIKDSKEFI